ncbi:MAG: S8 family serine peptidase [Cyanobacteria bacterium P01_D01_bin.156]
MFDPIVPHAEGVLTPAWTNWAVPGLDALLQPQPLSTNLGDLLFDLAATTEALTLADKSPDGLIPLVIQELQGTSATVNNRSSVINQPPFYDGPDTLLGDMSASVKDADLPDWLLSSGTHLWQNTSANEPATSNDDTLVGPRDLGSLAGAVQIDGFVGSRGQTNYQLNLSAEAIGGIRTESGYLWADTFTHQSGYAYTVFSGNGNVQFGDGYRDLIDLSNIDSSTVSFNLAGINGDGMLHNPGNGMRIFDAITLSNGEQILFEGIDTLSFADGDLNLSTIPNDPYFGYQWNLHMMGVHNAWRFTTGSADDVLVGVQDTGLMLDFNGAMHTDLDANRTYVDLQNYSDESLDASHGAAVQSIIAAATNNNSSMSGINWASNVLHLDVLGGESTDYDLADATEMMINEAARNDQRLVINMSLGLDSQGTVGISPNLERLIANHQEDVLFVIATGNDDQNYLSYPANLANLYGNVMAIGASWGMQDVDGNPKVPGDRISYPGWWGSNFGYGMSLMGPSEVVAAESAPWNVHGYTGVFNGTSAATPNVAGVASLVWSANPDLAATEVHQILAQTAYDLGIPGYDQIYGNGFVNADAAVRQALAWS